MVLCSINYASFTIHSKYSSFPRTQCPTGYYSPGSSASCFMCSRGFACPVPEATPTPCSPGTYSLDGSVNCTLCDAGYTCQDPTSECMHDRVLHECGVKLYCTEAFSK